MKKVRIGYQDRDGKGSCAAYVTQFHNAINQVRNIAFDGQRYFVQANNKAPFKPVSEEEVPNKVK